MMEKSMTFMAACRDYFGLKEGQTGIQFGAEIKALTNEDRVEIAAGLEKEGYKLTGAIVKG